MYQISCEVWGRLGHRSALLKSNGVVVNFDNLADAEAEADRLDEEMNRPGSVASFQYSVIGGG